MKILFVDFMMLINGCYIDQYNIENGERIDFLCFTHDKYPFCSYIAYNNQVIVCNDFDILTDDRTILAFVKKNSCELKIFLQHNFAFDTTNGLASVYRDGHNYLSIESDNGYNIFELPFRSTNFVISTNYYGDILYLNYYVDGCKTLSVYDLRSLNCIQTIIADEINIDDNSITCFIERMDILLRKSTLTYEIRDGKCRKITDSFECTNVHVCTDALLGVLFLEAVISGDFGRISKDYVSSELQDDFDTFMSLFDGITGFTPVCYNDNEFIVEFLDKRELFEFICQNGKIIDILTN